MKTLNETTKVIFSGGGEGGKLIVEDWKYFALKYGAQSVWSLLGASRHLLK